MQNIATVLKFGELYPAYELLNKAVNWVPDDTLAAAELATLSRATAQVRHETKGGYKAAHSV